MTLSSNCIIIGAGPAGITASIYLKRANIDTLILEKNMPGGQLNNASVVKNYPGILEISGSDLAIKMFEQINHLGINYDYGNLISFDKVDDYFNVQTDKNTYTCKYLIIATGKVPRKLNIENEEELLGKGISYCATCDGPLYKGKEVVVIGSNETAIEEAKYLSNIASKVTIIGDVEEPLDGIEVVPAKVLGFLSEEEALSGVKISLDDEEKIIDCAACFIYNGTTPMTSVFKNLDILDDKGHVIVNENFETKIENLYAVGDVVNKPLHQIVTAVNDGAIAATSIIKKRNK